MDIHGKKVCNTPFILTANGMPHVLRASAGSETSDRLLEAQWKTQMWKVRS